jgi:trypsin
MKGMYGKRRAVIAACAATGLAAAGLLAGATTAAAVHGGQSATTTAYPYAMLIETPDGVQWCGGTLVAPTKVLTAGHCVTEADAPKKLLVIGGRTRLDSGAGTVRHVASVTVERRFVQQTLTYDAAVLTLSRPMPYRTAPVAGPADTALYANGRTATVVGWGATGTGVLATRLKAASLRLAPLPSCAPFTDPGESPALKVCGVPRTGTTDSVCRGDSGGPLLAGGKVIGIVSTGNKYCDTEYPYSVFTRASAVAHDLGLPTG